MNKKLIVVGVLSLVVLTLGLAGYAYAQGQSSPPDEYPYGPDMMDGYGGHVDEMMGSGYGMMGSGMMGWQGGEGPMHEGMIASLAESLDLSPQEIEASHDGGESIWEIAAAEGLTDEEIRQLMFSTHDAVFTEAMNEGLLTSDQADWMNDHMNQMWTGDDDHCGGMSGNENGVRWHGMDW